jgi:hypothetical protein
MWNAIRSILVCGRIVIPFVSVLSCGTPIPPEAPDRVAIRAPAPDRTAAVPQEAAAEAVVLIAIDGVRWQDVFHGVDPAFSRPSRGPVIARESAESLLPAIHSRMIRGGIALGAPGGDPMTASGPNYVSVPGYQEMLTGGSTGCVHNECAAVDTPTIADRIRNDLASCNNEVAVIASWERLERAAAVAPGRIAVSAGRGGERNGLLATDPLLRELLDAGDTASPHPGHGAYRPDAYTAPIALRYLVVARPRFLFVGLGDTDEHAHDSRYGDYLGSLRYLDTFVERLFLTLESMGERGRRTAVLLTTDHGRSRSFTGHGGGSPESGRVFLVMGGAGIPARGVVRLGRPLALGEVADSVLGLLGVPGESTRPGPLLASLGLSSLPSDR